jgi:protein-disulfide isomerase
MAKKTKRKLTKAQARAEALRRKRRRQMAWALVGVVAVAVVVVLVLIAMTGGEGEGSASVEEKLLLAGDYPSRGADDAPVTIVELSDYNCPHCRDFALEAFPLIDDEFVASGQVKYVIRPYALWEESLPIVEATACAQDQGGFWDFHHLLFENNHRFSRQQPPSRDMLRELAEASGLDADELLACLDQGRHREDVRASTEAAKGQLGVNSTPTVFVNGLKTPASVDAIRAAIWAAQAGRQN